MLVSGVGQSDLTYMYTYIVFHILLCYGLLQDIEYSSLCYRVGTCLFIQVAYICSSQTPNLSLLSPFPFGKHTFVFYVGESLFCK